MHNELPFAIGRKNYLFAGSDASGECAAAMYSLLRSAKLNGIHPEAYMTELLPRVADHPINRIEELLPWRHLPGKSGGGGSGLTVIQPPNGSCPQSGSWTQSGVSRKTNMDWLTIDSKMLASVAYDAEKRIHPASALAMYTASSTFLARHTRSF